MLDGDSVIINSKNKNISGVGASNSLSQDRLSPSAPAPLFDTMHRGYFPLWRKIRDWGWYKDVNTKSVFIELLLLSNFKENYYLGHKILRGQCVAGRKTLSASLGMSERQIRTALKHLLSTNEITIKNCNKFSIITLNNFETYLINDQRAVHQTTSKRPDIDQQVTTPYNDKNDKNVNKGVFIPPTLQSIKDYIQENKYNVNADEFYKFFTAGDWKDSNGKKVISWKQKVITWNNHAKPGQKITEGFRKP